MRYWTTSDEECVMPKFCTVADCRVPVPSQKYFCRKHWDMIPWDLKQWIAECYLYPELMTTYINEARKHIKNFILESAPRLHD